MLCCAVLCCVGVVLLVSLLPLSSWCRSVGHLMHHVHGAFLWLYVSVRSFLWLCVCVCDLIIRSVRRSILHSRHGAGLPCRRLVGLASLYQETSPQRLTHETEEEVRLRRPPHRPVEPSSTAILLSLVWYTTRGLRAGGAARWCRRTPPTQARFVRSCVVGWLWSRSCMVSLPVHPSFRCCVCCVVRSCVVCWLLSRSLICPPLIRYPRPRQGRHGLRWSSGTRCLNKVDTD